MMLYNNKVILSCNRRMEYQMQYGFIAITQYNTIVKEQYCRNTVRRYSYIRVLQ